MNKSRIKKAALAIGEGERVGQRYDAMNEGMYNKHMKGIPHQHDVMLLIGSRGRGQHAVLQCCYKARFCGV